METLGTVIISVLASTGIATVIMKWVVENALKEAQEKRKRDQDHREERYRLDDEYQYAVSSVLFWVHHGIQAHEKAEPHGYWNGELRDAFEEMDAIKDKRKKLDRIQLAEINDK